MLTILTVSLKFFKASILQDSPHAHLFIKALQARFEINNLKLELIKLYNKFEI